MTDLEREASEIVEAIAREQYEFGGTDTAAHTARIVELAKRYAEERDGAYADCGHLVPVLSFYRFDPVALTAVDNCAQRHACLGCDGCPVCEAGCVKDCTCPPSS